MDPPDQPIPPTRRDEEGLWVPCCTKILVPIKIKDDFLLYNVGTPPGYKRGDTFLVHLMYPPSQYKIQDIDNEVSTEQMVFFKIAWNENETDEVKNQVQLAQMQLLGAALGPNNVPPPEGVDEIKEENPDEEIPDEETIEA